MIFEKSSTRTRVSFEAGMAQFGGHAMFLSPRDTQLGRGEPIEDTARVLSRMVDAVMIRTFAQETVERFAAHSRVPVINGLTDRLHPCQLLADMQTYFEHRGDIRGRRVAWIGDGNNMCNSYMEAARLFDFAAAHRLSRRASSRTPSCWPRPASAAPLAARPAGGGRRGRSGRHRCLGQHGPGRGATQRARAGLRRLPGRREA